MRVASVTVIEISMDDLGLHQLVCEDLDRKFGDLFGCHFADIEYKGQRGSKYFFESKVCDNISNVYIEKLFETFIEMVRMGRMMETCKKDLTSWDKKQKLKPLSL